MKATGGDTKQIFGMYLAVILGFGVGALMFAIPLANFAAHMIGRGMAAWLNFFQVPTEAMRRRSASKCSSPSQFLPCILPIYHSVCVTIREQDSFALLEMFKKITGEKPSYPRASDSLTD